MTSSLDISEAIGAQGATAPRVSLDSMKAKIVDETYFTLGEALRAMPNGTEVNPALDILTLCVLVMENGFVLIGKSAPASPENFDPDKGRTFAFEDAIRQLWPMEGYALRERIRRSA